MSELVNLLQDEGHAILEMPTGTGKTVCLLSLITSYIKQVRPTSKLIYCTRTIVEMEKTLEELKTVMRARAEDFGDTELGSPLLALCLSSRRNLCVHPQVSQLDDREAVDSACRGKTASWVAALADIEDLAGRCKYFDNFEAKQDKFIFPTEVYTLDDLKELGRQLEMCPYFLARQFLTRANVIVFSYAYILDPKIANLVSAELQNDCIVVFDECHNIDNACIEALSLNMNRRSLERATTAMKKLEDLVRQEKEIGSERLKKEYAQLVKGLAQQKVIKSEQEMLQHPILEKNILKDGIPGSIRKADHFLPMMRKLIVYFKKLMQNRELQMLSPLQVVYQLQETYLIDQRTLKFTQQRLAILLNTLQVPSIDEFGPLNLVATLATMISTFFKGFTVIVEPYPEDQLIFDPLIQFYCLDASLATAAVFKKYRNVVLTSGTISPMEIYPRMLNFTPKVTRAFNIVLPRNAIQPLVLTKGADQLQVSSKFDERENAGIVRNFGNMVVELAGIVPDGMVCFFTSYKYMEHIVVKWNEMGLLQKILEHKLIFIETKDNMETVMALDNYKKACDNGRGAVFFSIARGKVSEGVDFAGHYGRCVMVFGIPFQNTLSRNLRARMQFLNENYKIREQDFLCFDAMRQTSQCVGRVLRSKYDYGLMIFADKRYKRKDFMEKVPLWIRQQMHTAHQDISTDVAVQTALSFFKDMGQNFEMPHEYLYGKEKIEQLEARKQQQTHQLQNGADQTIKQEQKPDF